MIFPSVPDLPQVMPALAALEFLVESPVLVLYVGPDQIMPLTSVLGAIVGMVLMFWQYILNFARRSRAFFSRRPEASERDQPAR